MHITDKAHEWLENTVDRELFDAEMALRLNNAGYYIMRDLLAETEKLVTLSNSRLENIKAMSSYLDDVAEALGVTKPSTPIEGIGACWKVMAAIQVLQPKPGK